MRRRLATIPCLIALLTPISAASQEASVYPSSFCIGCAKVTARAPATASPETEAPKNADDQAAKIHQPSTAQEPPEPLFNRAAIFALILSGDHTRIGH